jgi:hypothetical protein
VDKGMELLRSSIERKEANGAVVRD